MISICILLRVNLPKIKNKKNYLKRNVNIEHQDILNAVLSRDVISAQKNLIKHYKITDKYFKKAR